MRIFSFVILFLLYIISCSDSYSKLCIKKQNTTQNFRCISKSNLIFSLKYRFKRISIKYTRKNITISFDKVNNNTSFLGQYKSLLPELKPKIKIYYFKDVVISNSGSIHTKHYNLRLDRGCKCLMLNNIIPKKKIKKYLKVIVLSQFWGGGVFHSLIECLTKISFVLSDLLTNNNMYIHIVKNKAIYNYLNLLGIYSNRTVTGFVNTKYAYVIENSMCGKSSGIIPLLYLKNKLNKRNRFYNEKQNVIIIIKRLYKRSIYNFENLVSLLKNIFVSYTIEIFLPNCLFNDTLYMFGKAKYIFAPHGAGLSNIILCHTNVIIFEFLIYSKPNLCYTSLSYSLGFKYYGLFQYFNGWIFILNISYLSSYIKNVIVR